MLRQVGFESFSYPTSACSPFVDASDPAYSVTDGQGTWQSLDAALKDVCSGGGIVWIPPKTRVLVAYPPLRITRGGVAIIGAGFSSEVGVRRQAEDASERPIIEIAGAGSAFGGSAGAPELDGILLQGFRLEGSADPGQTAIRVNGCPYRVTLQDLWVDGFALGGVEADGRFTFSGEGIRVIGGCQDVVVNGANITACGSGLRVEPGDSGRPNATVRSSMFANLSAVGLYAGSHVNIFVMGCLFEHCNGPAILAENASVFSVRNCHVENCWSLYATTDEDGDIVCIEQPGFHWPRELANYRVVPGGPGWPRAVIHVRSWDKSAHVHITGNHLYNECADGAILLSGAMSGVVRGNDVRERTRTAAGLFSIQVQGAATEGVTNLGNHALDCSECETLHTSRCG